MTHVSASVEQGQGQSGGLASWQRSFQIHVRLK